METMAEIGRSNAITVAEGEMKTAKKERATIEEAIIATAKKTMKKGEKIIVTENNIMISVQAKGIRCLLRDMV